MNENLPKDTMLWYLAGELAENWRSWEPNSAFFSNHSYGFRPGCSAQ